MNRNLGIIFYTFAIPISTLAGYGYATSFKFTKPLIKYFGLNNDENI